MGYIFLFLLGFGLAISGGITVIAYMNFLPAGITWYEYVHFISRRMECYFFPLGVIIVSITIHKLPFDKLQLK
ncbi:MAG TPA: hypothetical protein H9895_09030 [Candidatus Pseudogracilibacillus intestinigallinarum]|uniref:Uncharacterized protein n=1 Tax=Candidatus Pseudogracilibacillus intestinigallinarum TaxID=2838742 RepID=A0A9D1TK71_9BACI|nr:hypothetical protein [Candidatus Pseudogracilibacillus intestinigallinarum]